MGIAIIEIVRRVNGEAGNKSATKVALRMLRINFGVWSDARQVFDLRKTRLPSDTLNYASFKNPDAKAAAATIMVAVAIMRGNPPSW